VKCDHVHPICGACTRGSHVCTWTDHVPGQTAAGRITKPNASGFGKVAKNSDVQSRLDRLELLLEKAVAGQGSIPQTSVRTSGDYERRDPEAHHTPSSHSQTSLGHQGIQADDGDGVLLIDEGRSQFVSSLHFALLAEEVRTSREPLALVVPPQEALLGRWHAFLPRNGVDALQIIRHHTTASWRNAPFARQVIIFGLVGW
jgi:hypothetical protein